MDPSAHQPALDFTHSGIPSGASVAASAGETSMIPAPTRNPIAPTNVASSMDPSAHQPALDFTHSGISACAAAANGRAIRTGKRCAGAGLIRLAPRPALFMPWMRARP